MNNEFDQVKYWKERHEKLKDDPRSVGNLAHSLETSYRGEKEVQSMVKLAVEHIAPLVTKNRM